MIAEGPQVRPQSREFLFFLRTLFLQPAEPLRLTGKQFVNGFLFRRKLLEPVVSGNLLRSDAAALLRSKAQAIGTKADRNDKACSHQGLQKWFYGDAPQEIRLHCDQPIIVHLETGLLVRADTCE